MRHRSAAAVLAVVLVSPLHLSTPPPTPVPPFASPSPFPTVLKTPPPSEEPPRLKAREAVLEDMDTGQVLFRKRATDPRPIASVTKIMTAWLVLHSASLSDVVTVGAAPSQQTGSRLGLKRGERIRVRDLLYALLLQSANDAAVALAEYVDGTATTFVRRMNREAKRLNLDGTKFFSPTGLDDRGHSTSLDLAKLTRLALEIPVFAQIVQTKTRDLPGPRKRVRHIQNRNVLLWLYRGALGVKSGFTTPAGHCLVAAAQRGGRRLVAVILGAPVNAFDDAAALLNFGFYGFRSITIVRPGDPLGRLGVQGVDVPVTAAGELTRLIPAGFTKPFRIVLKAKGGLHLPLARGQRLGRAFVFAKRRLGSVPIVSATATNLAPVSVLPPPARRRLAPALRLLELVIRAVLDAFL